MWSLRPKPRALAASAVSAGDGSMWGRGLALSFTASMSKKTAPGMWPAAYSAWPERGSPGMNQVASTTLTFGSRRRADSQSTDTSGGVEGAATVRRSRGASAAPFR